MKQPLLLVLLLALLLGVNASGVRANLGDSDDRIDDSYGKLVRRQSLDDGTVKMLYHKDRYLCAVVFDQRQSVSETYCRIDERELSTKEIDRFLKANKGGRATTWTRQNNTPSSKEQRFERSDHKAEAIYGEVDGHPTLKVESKKAKAENRK
jgi:hypothetical protein